jgi:hypothetical protein
VAVDDDKPTRRQRRALESRSRRSGTAGEVDRDPTPPKVTVLQRLGGKLLHIYAATFPRKTVGHHFGYVFVTGILIGLFIGGFVAAGLLYLAVGVAHRHR